MKTPLKSLFPATLAASLLITGCGSDDDNGFYPFPTPTNTPSTTAYVQAGATGDGSNSASPAPTVQQAQSFLSQTVPGQATTIRILPGTLSENVTLSEKQTLTADSGLPTLNGTITLANDSSVSSLQVLGGGLVVNSGTANFTIEGCTVASTTGDGIALTNPGNGRLRNNTLQNNAGRGIHLTANSGSSFQLDLEGNTVSNSALDGVFLDVGGSSNVTWNETGSVINNAGNGVLAAGSSWNINTTGSSNFRANWMGCTSDTTNRFGLEVYSQGTSSCTFVFDQGIIRNGVDRGINLLASDGSVMKARISDTQASVNSGLPGFGIEAANASSATLALRFVGVITDGWQLFNNNPSAVYNIENFAGLAADNPGSGPVLALGTINDVPVGSQGIP